MTLSPLTSEQFDQLESTDRYYRGRWPYLRTAVQMAVGEDPRRALELGPYRRPLLHGSDVMDRRSQLQVGDVDFVWDARKTPWPIADKSYDLFVALQVWEHLGPAQVQAFAEVRRIAQCAILSFPLRWDMPDPTDCHHGITMDKIRSWTGPPTQTLVVGRPAPTHKRAVCLYRF